MQRSVATGTTKLWPTRSDSPARKSTKVYESLRKSAKLSIRTSNKPGVLTVSTYQNASSHIDQDLKLISDYYVKLMKFMGKTNVYKVYTGRSGFVFFTILLGKKYSLENFYDFTGTNFLTYKSPDCNPMSYYIFGRS